MKTNIKNYGMAVNALLCSSLLMVSCANTISSIHIPNEKNDTTMLNNPVHFPDEKVTNKKIKIALLLDTSNSMDGLIDQAKSQLWKLVNELSLASVDSIKPTLEIALYEYGNQGLPINEGFIRQVTPFTNELDVISEKLFALRTNGGEEYCGQVIQTACNQLNWGDNTGDLKIIFIAGNEPFTQGTINAKTSCGNAQEKGLIVNSIFCGPSEEGISSGWKNGATWTGGEFMAINQDEKTQYIETPYDAEIGQLNEKLNDTYVYYGSLGYSKKTNQAVQDANASTYGTANIASRAVSKSSAFYTNVSWDLVDASKDKLFDVAKVKDQELPAELKGKTKEEKQKYITVKNSEREAIKKRIGELNVLRMKYITEKEKELKLDHKSLDASMLKAIREQAAKKNFVFAKV